MTFKFVSPLQKWIKEHILSFASRGQNDEEKVARLHAGTELYKKYKKMSSKCEVEFKPNDDSVICKGCPAFIMCQDNYNRLKQSEYVQGMSVRGAQIPPVLMDRLGMFFDYQ